jgi:REP element-mobilizing transposase RayT
MPSKNVRIPFEAGGTYHIFNRANNREKLFYSDSDYVLFLNLFDLTLNELVDTYSYCLLPNHFHFLFRIKDQTDSKDFNKNLRRWFIKYAMIINAQEDRRGSLFTKSVKRIKVEDEEYLKQLIYYINTNSIRHNILSNYEHYPYSSYSEIINGYSDIVDVKLVLNFFNHCKSEFAEFHKIKHSLQYYDYLYLDD